MTRHHCHTTTEDGDADDAAVDADSVAAASLDVRVDARTTLSVDDPQTHCFQVVVGLPKPWLVASADRPTWLG